jgi:predicted HTH transcriptional regulator
MVTQIPVNEHGKKKELRRNTKQEPDVDYEYLGGGIVSPYITIEEYLLKILQDGPMTRGELSTVTGIPRTTLYDTLVKLLMQNKVEKFSLSKHKRGRPNVYYRLSS